MSPPHSTPLAQDLNIVSKVLFRKKTRLGNFSGDVIDHDEYAKDYGYSSDSDLEDDGVASLKQKSKSKDHLFESRGIPGGGRRIPCEEHDEHSGRGKVLKIPDVAFVT